MHASQRQRARRRHVDDKHHLQVDLVRTHQAVVVMQLRTERNAGTYVSGVWYLNENQERLPTIIPKMTSLRRHQASHPVHSIRDGYLSASRTSDWIPIGQ
jgi:hypothetical protein